MNIEKWSPLDMIEIKLADTDSFLKIRETLTRIGIPSKEINVVDNSELFNVNDLKNRLSNMHGHQLDLEIEFIEDNYPSLKIDIQNVLYQSCHILHKRGRYFIVHFKELFALDGKQSSLSSMDILRRNAIAKLLAEWGMCTVVNPDMIRETESMENIRVLKHSEKNAWILKTKYNIGVK